MTRKANRAELSTQLQDAFKANRDARANLAILAASHQRVLERCNALFAENRALRLVASEEALFLQAVMAGLTRARAKHPGNAHMLAGLYEEGGEVARALQDGEGPARVYEECVDVAIVALRLAIEGCGDFPQEKKQ